MNLKNFLEGLDILKPYFKELGYHLGAEHDQIYLYATDTPLTADDVAKMQALGWFQPDSGANADYDPENGWSVNV